MNILKEMRETIYENKVEFFLFVLIGFTCCFFFFYSDQTDTAGQSVVYIESILKGNFMGAYQDYIDLINSDINHGANFPMVYTAFSYLLVGIFSLPLVIIDLICGINYNGLFFTCYIKFEQVTLCLLCSYLVYLICKELDMSAEKCRYALILSLTSCYALYFAVVIGQMEIYVSFFSLLGVLYWLKDEKWKFIVCFSIAIPIKMFALLIFVPLILIKEKRVFRILGYIFVGSFFLFFEKIVYSLDDAYRLSTAEPSARIISGITATQLPSAFSGVPIFVLLYILLCIYVYLKDNKEKIWGIYISFVVYSLMFILVGHYPYWIVILAPFIPILIVFNEKKVRILLLLDIITTIAYMVCSIFFHPWSCNAGIVARMFLPKIVGEKPLEEMKYVFFADAIKDYGITSNHVILFTAIYIAGFIGMIYVSNPYKEFNMIDLGINKKILSSIRVITIVPFLMAMLYCFFSVKPDKLFETVNVTYEESDWNIFSEEVCAYGEHAISQTVTFEKDSIVEKVYVFFTRLGNSYSACGSVYVSLEDATTNEVLVVKRKGYNELIYGDFTKFNFDGIEVFSDHQYRINIYSDKVQAEQQYAHVLLTEENIECVELQYLGTSVDRDLYMKIEGNFK